MTDKIIIKSADGKEMEVDDTPAMRLVQTINDSISTTKNYLNEDPDCQYHPEGFDRICRKYLLRDKWTLFQAANLVYGCMPHRANNWVHQQLDDTDIGYWVRQIKELSVNCANESLNIINPQEPQKKWMVRPKEYVIWAQSKRINVSEILLEAYANQFQAVEARQKDKPHGNTIVNAEKQQRVKDAAMKALAEFPNECRSKAGKVLPSRIAKLLDEKSVYFFNDPEPPMERQAMSNHIGKALK